MNVGSGDGLLSMLASKAGADFVTGCDTSQHMVSTAQQVLRDNKVLRGRKRGKVRLVTADVRQMEPPTQAEKHDILITDLFDCQVCQAWFV